MAEEIKQDDEYALHSLLCFSC